MLSSILNVSTHPLNRRGLALYFWLDPKVPKDQVSRDASLRSWPLRCKAGKTWGGACCRIFAQAIASGNIPDTPAAAQSGIVLPAFARSDASDGI